MNYTDVIIEDKVLIMTHLALQKRFPIYPTPKRLLLLIVEQSPNLCF